MAGAGLSYGLNLKKKSAGNKVQTHKPRVIFGEDDEECASDSKTEEDKAEDITEIVDFEQDAPPPCGISNKNKKLSPRGSRRPITGNSKADISIYGDLSAIFTSKKHTDAAKDLDENIYDYDGVYDSLKPQRRVRQENEDRKPKYMASLIEAAAVRKRDAAIAEEKKLARDREAEGDEYADKEKFVTSAYKKKQEENRRLEEEERIREEQEARNNKNTGMTSFYKKVLEKGEQKHAEIVKAVDERIKNGPAIEVETVKVKTAAELAREINEKNAGAIIVNDEGDVVDKRQLLAGGLNIISKTKPISSTDVNRSRINLTRSKGSEFVGVGGGKQAMRERQSRMIEAQLEQTTKRALEQEEEDRKRIEKASKSRKTGTEIMSAKERYLARKKEAEEKSKGAE
ncbi:hypothetical protein K3495_g3753 [Podosphaera aphanis]|nr:hypothetical protein K3495_g3753 [Podosphaera aphanis]